ncbi:MAG: CBS domain-containing protein [Candidatus Woesearchaeota archaeon]|nr:MAG: CBS domain-containing protein [Candidatus Woesearchaeota archaeon]
MSELTDFQVKRREHAERLRSELEVKQLCAKDAMVKPVLLYPDDTVKKILKKLEKEHVNACIVVTKEKKFLGEISDNDIVRLFLQQVKYEPLVQLLNIGYRREFLHKSAISMINKHKSFVRADTPINKVIKLVGKKGFEYVPVLNENDKVIGVVTPSSIIKLLKDY